jgi:hypothetical protein
MAMTFEEFQQRTNAELVAGNIIVGNLADRKIVGTFDGAFNLNEAGQALLAELEAAPAEKPARKSKKAAEGDAPADAAPTEEVKPE